MVREILLEKIQKVLAENFGLVDFVPEIQQTKPDFEGDFTVVTFPLVKVLKKSPDIIATELGDKILLEVDFVENYNIVKGFLNLKLKDNVFLQSFKNLSENLEKITPKNETIMVEYSSPNTNKPLHLGHIRNNLLGFSIANILKEEGYNVIKTQIINDRGIHICKSMLAWEKFGNGATPESTQTKGD